MSRLDEALRRLGGAVARLESAVADGGVAGGGPAGGGMAGGDPDLVELRAERDELSDQVRRLRAGAARDARLRAEAAAAVRDALHDLRGAIGQGPEEMRGNA